MEMEEIEFDELMSETTPAEDEIETLAREIDEELKKSESPLLMLHDAIQLTVATSKGYSKASSVGGEEFKVIGCYAGKRKKLIYIFKPIFAAHYASMEMEEQVANKVFGREFTKYVRDITGYDFQQRKIDAVNAASVQAEREKLKEKAKQYESQGWGDW